MSAVAEVQALFDARVKQGIPTPPGEFHRNDIENRVKNENYIKRVLLHQDDNIKAATDMLWEICVWRSMTNANELDENNLNVEMLKDGGMFPRGRDIENSLLLIFKCKLHVKGQKDFEELKKCIIYWFDRLEREENGKPISLFFDMDGCGLGNMDMEFIKYLISLMKHYYPAFLQYIFIYQMPWVLTAAFKVVKTLLPAKAVSKMKFVSNDNLKEYVAPEQALVCWGGKDDYVFEFVSENRTGQDITPKKVTFAEQGDSQHSPGEMLKVTPNDVIVFINENDELSGTVTLMNMDEGAVSFKIRTTSPEKFRVRPSSGTLAPGASQSINIAVQHGFHLRTVPKDRFLIMSVQIPKLLMTQQELAELWQKSSGSKVDEYRLKCQFPDKEKEVTKNGNVTETRLTNLDEKPNAINVSLTKLQHKCDDMNRQIKTLKLYQTMTLFMTVLAAFFGFLVYKSSGDYDTCERPM